MSSQSRRAMFAAMMMILASLAGCIGTDDLEVDDTPTESLGTVIASTYHVEQLASAVGGDLVTVEMMSTMNVPVHDYEPSASDLVRLSQADVFFYHGLGLEPWVEGALANMDGDGPVAVETHSMPTGETTLDYESMLIENLCASLTDPATTDVHILAEHAEDAEELHSDDAGHNMAFPEDDHDEDHHDEDGHDEDDHDEDGHDEDDEDGHDEDGHDEDGHDEDGHDEDGHDEDHHDEDGHDEHDHGDEGQVMAEETIENPAGCPSGTVISVYHLEAGEYMLEFEAEDMETFRMAIAAMGGAHDHGHDHGGHGDHDDHDDHGEEHHVCHDMTTHENHDEYTTEEECEAAGHSWMEDAHADEEGPVCHDEDTHENHDEYETEEACEAAGYHWMEDDHDGHDGHDDHDDHNDEMTPEEALSQFDTDGDGNLSWDEFWVAWNTDEDDDHDDHDHEDEHHDENETDGDHHDENETDGDHDDHDHEDEHTPLEEAMEDYMMETLMTMFNESDADSSGGLSLEELEHFIEDIDAMEGDDMGMPTGEFIVGAFDEDGDGALSFEEFSEMMGMEHDHDHDDNETHDGNETHDDNETSEDEFMEAMMQMMFDMYDMNSDGSLDASEVDMMFEMMMQEDDHHEEGVAFIGLHVEEEGDYGIALPEGVSLHVLMDGDHEGHDHGDHDDHDDHGDHSDDEDGHDDHDDDEGDHDEDDHSDHAGEEIAFDPHSWLDPVAFAAQVEVVYVTLSTVFPDGADTFRANADAYKAQLMALDEGFSSALGDDGTCTTDTVAANHNAYAYISQRYGVEFVTLHGLDPEGEPSPETVAEVLERVEEDGITAIYVEEYTANGALDSLIQQTVSDDLPNGLAILTLYTMEMAPSDASGEDYLSLMGKNLENLKTGLGC